MVDGIEVENANEKVKQLQMENGGKLPAYAWPGGYALIYVDEENNALCYDCAKKNDEYCSPLEDSFVHWEGQAMYCDHCSAELESEYGDPEEEKQIEKESE